MKLCSLNGDDLIQLFCLQNGSCSDVWINATNANNVFIDCNALYSYSGLSLYTTMGLY